MNPPVHVTLEITQDCIDQATLTPTNSPVARAAKAAGLTGIHVGHSVIAANDPKGRPMYAAVSPALLQTIRRFDTGAVVVPASFPASFSR